MIAPLLLAASIASGAVDGPALAAVEFRPPPAVRGVDARPPALWEGVVLEGTAERARMVLFVVPAPAGASRRERVEAALDVASVYARPLGGAAVEGTDDVESIDGFEVEVSSGLETVRLVLARLDGRTAGLLLTGVTEEVDRLADAHRAAAESIRASARIHPPLPGEAVLDGRLGCSFRPPVGFEEETPDAPGAPRRFALPPHLGLSAAVDLSVLDAFVDAPFEEAAAALRDTLAAEGETGDAELGRLGPLKAFRVDHVSDDDRRHRVHCVELHGRRLLLTYTAPSHAFARFEPAFTESAATFAAAERHLEVALAPAVSDDRHGFTIRPPLRFAAVGGEAERAFEEADRTPPRHRLVVRRVDAALDPDDLDACVRWTAARAAAAGDDGWVVVEAARPLLLNGRRGAQVGLRSSSDGSIRQDRWTVIGHDGTIELTFTSTRDERDLYRETVEASLRTFRPRPPARPHGLADAVSGPDDRVSFRPPIGWSETGRTEDAVIWQASDPADGRLEVRIARATSGGSLADRVGRVREAVGTRIAADGGDGLVVEESTTRLVDGRPEVRLRLRYERDGRTRKGFHRVVLGRGWTVHVAAEIDGKRDAEALGGVRAAVESVEFGRGG